MIPSWPSPSRDRHDRLVDRPSAVATALGLAMTLLVLGGDVALLGRAWWRGAGLPTGPLVSLCTTAAAGAALLWNIVLLRRRRASG